MSEYADLPPPHPDYQPGAPIQGPSSPSHNPPRTPPNPFTRTHEAPLLTEDAFFPALPVGYDSQSTRSRSPDTALTHPDEEFRVWAVESRAEGSELWELRPHTEHRGGRAWSKHFQRLTRIAGVWHHGALVFSDKAIAIRAARTMREARIDGTEFQVVELTVRTSRQVVEDPDQARWRRVQQQELRLPPSLTPEPWRVAGTASLGALGSWLGSQSIRAATQ